MRITIFAVLFSIFLIVPAIAGNLYKIDMSTSPTQPVYVSEGDEVRLTLFDNTHAFVVRKITPTDIEFAIAPFLEDSNHKMFPGFVTLDTVMRIDFDKDGITDLNVALYSVSEDGVAHVVFQSVTKNGAVPTGLVVDEGEKSSGRKSIMLGIIVGIVILLVAFLIFRRTKSAKESVETEQISAEKKS